jgi:hypothetical protein
MTSESSGRITWRVRLARLRASATAFVVVCVGGAALAVVALAGTAAAQEPGAAGGKPVRGAPPIEIRGQVPTPQVVTVRPREIPTFSREVLTPSYFDVHFWRALLTPYELAPNLSSGAGATPLPSDSTFRLPPAADSAHPAPPAARAPSAGESASTASRGTPPNAPREK